MRRAWMLLPMLGLGCLGEIGGVPLPRDAGEAIDAGPRDAGGSDASLPDAGEDDAGAADAGAPDAGVDAGIPDAGPAIDAGAPVYDAGTVGDGKFTIGPTYSNDPDSSPKAGVPKGKVYAFTMSSSTSAIFPGVTGAYTRAVSVYVPSQYVDGTAAPFMVVQDGQGYVGRVRDALDNLIAERRVPPVVAILINPGPGDGRGSERGYEYDTVSEDYTRFIETEVLPIVPQRPDLKADHPNLRFTSDPEGRASMGCSSGGAAAFTMGWFRPDLYRRILTFSGTFVNQAPTAAYPASAWEYHQHLIAQTPFKPLRVHLEVGQNDLNLDANFGDMQHDWVKANNAMFAALNAKGNHVRYLFAQGAGHCDGRVFGQTLPTALEWLWRGYPLGP
jgi:enterochelin esterase-like enzyme